MTSVHGEDVLEVLLMARDDHFSEVVRQELRCRGIRFAEIDPGRLQGTVVPTLVVHGSCAGGEVTYEGFGRISREFLARYDATLGADRVTSSPAGRARPAATAR
jgi:hypothetical protein